MSEARTPSTRKLLPPWQPPLLPSPGRLAAAALAPCACARRRSQVGGPQVQSHRRVAAARPAGAWAGVVPPPPPAPPPPSPERAARRRTTPFCKRWQEQQAGRRCSSRSYIEHTKESARIRSRGADGRLRRAPAGTIRAHLLGSSAQLSTCAGCRDGAPRRSCSRAPPCAPPPTAARGETPRSGFTSSSSPGCWRSDLPAFFYSAVVIEVRASPKRCHG